MVIAVGLSHEWLRDATQHALGIAEEWDSQPNPSPRVGGELDITCSARTREGHTTTTEQDASIPFAEVLP